MQKPIAIYLHVPFCKRKCAYCDFASFSGQEGLFQRYFAALGEEISIWKDELCAHEAHSVFFGGGTPSLAPAEYIVKTLQTLRRTLPFAVDAEITLEANPGTFTPEKLHAYRAAGVNRLSIGVQSFDDGLLRCLGRIHTAQEAVQAVYMAREAGFENISIDLMYALPDQSMEMWQDTLQTAVALPLEHVSAYSLIVEEGTPMERWVREGRVRLPDEDAANEMQRMAAQILSVHGLERYEISNYARRGRESRHNITYWRGGEYLGLGSAAHSLFGNVRFENPPELDRYLAGARRLNPTRRSVQDRREEWLMLETRMTSGLNLQSWREEFGDDLREEKSDAIQKLLDYGMIQIQDDRLRLTTRGLELQDSVVLELLD